MLKRFVSIAAALVLGACAFAQTSADGGATPAAAGSVNATWEWNKIPKSKIGTDAMSFKKQIVLAPVDGSKGAQFALENGETKFKQEEYVALYHNNKGSCTLETLEKNRKAEYSVSIEDAATITLTITGNGFGEPSRCLALYNEAGEMIVSADKLNKDNPHTVLTFANAPKGTYKIWTNGSRIIKVEAKN